MSAELVAGIAHSVGLILLYTFVGFGPGLLLGILLGNRFGARGQETLMQKQGHQIETASEHNAQWDPTHERWQQ